ncbi:MAG: putative DNA-binding protein [Firmicutes bacterium]|nr:putative DNA-binding protein [Bacillota bacterium]
MDKLLEITLLYDFYGELLTDKQKSVMELYYLNDFSLHEIAAEHGITRQAVLDMIKRTEKLLAQYEQKLGLVSKYLEQKAKLDRITEKLKGIIKENGLVIEGLDTLTEELSQILD